MRDNNSVLGRLGVIVHNVFPADIFEQLTVFAWTLILAGLFSRAIASVHLCGSYAPPVVDQLNIQNPTPAR